VTAMNAAHDQGPDARGQLDRLLEEDPADLYENAPMGYLSTLPDGRIVKVNHTFCAWTGWPAEEVVGSRFQDLLTVGGRVFHETHLRPLLRMQGVVREIAVDVVRIDGSLLPCLLNAVEVRDEDGAQVLVRATLFEATARRRYERELLAAQRGAEESEARSRMLQQVVSDLAAATTVGDVAKVIVEHGRKALRAQGAAVLLVDEPEDGGAAEDPELHTQGVEGLPAGLMEELREAALGQLALELAQGVRSVPLNEQLRQRQPRLAASMVEARLSELVIVPVAADSRRLGVLVVGLGDRQGALISLEEPGEARPPAPAEVDLLWTLGRQAGQALERARLHEETDRQAKRAAFLLEAARMLAEAVDAEDTVQRVADLAVGRLADVCAVDLVDEQGMTRPIVRHRDPARQHLADELRERHLPHRGSAHPSAQAVREGRTVWARSLPAEFLTEITQDARHLEVARELELVSLISVPFLAEGRPLGVLTLAADAMRGRFTEADVEVAEQLALQVGLVVAKAQRYELDMRTSHTLQANLLPGVPP
jgi:PAS domain S-box-containing protein